MNELLQKYAELDLDAIFERFYDQMLSDKDFSGFFRGEEQIRSLIQRQKRFLLDSIAIPADELKQRYIRLGELHYDLKLPYVDYMAAIGLLHEGMMLAIVEYGQPLELLDATAQFFKKVRAYAAKGYLNRMLEKDMRDIDLYLAQVQRAAEVDTTLSTERMLWLKNIIFAIKIENRAAAPALHLSPEVLESIRAATQGDQLLLDYVSDIAGRMEVDARNIFYFLDRHSYEEVLPLYTDLTNIYKLSLMLTNVVTVASTNLLVRTLSKDALTGLLTRHALKPVFHRELSIATANQYEISFIMFDIDYFKEINDSHGHHAGDAVLTRVAGIAAETIRSTDYSFRMGGEEFLLVLNGASRRIAASQAEAIRQTIENTEFDFNGQTLRVTASFGIATFAPPFVLDYENMIKAADAKLYDSKRNGRNRVSV